MGIIVYGRATPQEGIEEGLKFIISVIVPVYNVENYITSCVESIRKQSYADLEILLIDDDSTDESGKICDEFAGMDDRVKVIHKANEGLSAARNVGLTIASGDYILFVDADDYIHPRMVETLLEVVREANVKIAMCDVLKVAEAETAFYVKKEKPRCKYITRRQAMLGLYKSWKYGVAWNKLYAREIFEKVRFRENILNEDLEIAVKLLRQTDYVGITSAVLYYYRQRSDSIMGSLRHINNPAIFEIYRARARYFASLKDQALLKANLEEVIYRYYDTYWLYPQLIEKRMLRTMRMELAYHLRTYGYFISWKRRIKLWVYIISGRKLCRRKG